ncbi:MAG: hypothetical protein R2710_19790 [Acidimicrobiales bacterium]
MATTTPVARLSAEVAPWFGGDPAQPTAAKAAATTARMTPV